MISDINDWEPAGRRERSTGMGRNRQPAGALGGGTDCGVVLGGQVLDAIASMLITSVRRQPLGLLCLR